MLILLNNLPVSNQNINLNQFPLFVLFFFCLLFESYTYTHTNISALNSLPERQVQGLVPFSNRGSQGTFQSYFCSVHGFKDLGRQAEISVRTFDRGHIHIFPIHWGLYNFNLLNMVINPILFKCELYWETWVNCSIFKMTVVLWTVFHEFVPYITFVAILVLYIWP